MLLSDQIKKLFDETKESIHFDSQMPTKIKFESKPENLKVQSSFRRSKRRIKHCFS